MKKINKELTEEQNQVLFKEGTTEDKMQNFSFILLIIFLLDLKNLFICFLAISIFFSVFNLTIFFNLFVICLHYGHYQLLFF